MAPTRHEIERQSPITRLFLSAVLLASQFSLDKASAPALECSGQVYPQTEQPLPESGNYLVKQPKNGEGCGILLSLQPDLVALIHITSLSIRLEVMTSDLPEMFSPAASTPPTPDKPVRLKWRGITVEVEQPELGEYTVHYSTEDYHVPPPPNPWIYPSFFTARRDTA
ncbi:MAG: hypothetical protein Q7S31_02495 [bacterium]|nr:hypothetical protein [bacterium]